MAPAQVLRFVRICCLDPISIEASATAQIKQEALLA
jgi:hypothetical protein